MLLVVHIILKYKDMHTELKVLPSSSSYERLIKFCIGSREAHLALMWLIRYVKLDFPCQQIHLILYCMHAKKAYVGAYDMLMGLEKVNVKPMPSMYNAVATSER
ncbi:hypothetical protein AKJ16_DCAP17233 [Drosera capensis]